MGNINPTFKDRVKYELYHQVEGTLVIPEPVGWRSDEKEYSRHKDYHGLVAKFSNNLQFVDSGQDFINLIDELHGINAEIKLTRYERHPITDVWTRIYFGFLDLSTKGEEDGRLSIKFSSGGLEQALKSRESEQVEIERTNTIDGVPIEPLVPKRVLLEGRRIFLKSTWETNEISNSAFLGVWSDDGNTRHQSTGFPFQLVNRSHEQAHSVLPNSLGNENQGSTGMMFFAIADRTRTIKVSSTQMKFTPFIREHDWQWAIFQVAITIYKDGINYNVKNRTVLMHYGENSPTNPDLWDIHNRTFNLTFDRTITLLAGESAAIEFLIKADLKNFTTSRARYYVDLRNLSGNLTVEEDSFFDQSECNCILAYELADRLITINTNKEKSLYSEFLGRTDIGYQKDGKASLTGNTHGFWVRGFESSSDSDNRFKPMTTSLRDFMTSYGAVWKLGLGIETINNRERVRLEELSFFYNFNVTIKLGQVKNEKRSTAADYFYSSLQFGYEEGGSYEEAMGLDEYNTKSNFTTIINRVKNDFTQISKYRADSYGKEFARRKPKAIYSTEDTSYDNSIFLMDLKRDINGLFRERKWQDDFQTEPTGTYSPETATNLRFSPFNCLLRHSWDFASGLIKYPMDYVRYGGSTANSALSTKLRVDSEYVSQDTSTPGNGYEYAENGNIINSELKRPRFKPEWVEFEYECDFDVMRQVEGSTLILGKVVPNFYGLVEFTNKKNITEKGFLFNLKPNGKGAWKVLTANR